MDNNFGKNLRTSSKALPLCAKSAEIRFAVAEGGEISDGAELLASVAGGGSLAVAELYAGESAGASGFPSCGLTRFFGTQAGEKGFYRGMEAMAVSGADGRGLEFGGKRVGICFEDGCARYAVLGGLFPRDLSAPKYRQALDVFGAMEGALKSAGMDFSNVFRTWFYNDGILDWYGDFNRARDAFFEKRGVFGRYVPASTGIGSRNAEGAAIMARAFAILPKRPDAKFSAVPSPLQCPALDYRSSFSRAAEFSHPNFRYLTISGTASIEPGGKTAHAGDIRGQINLSLDVAGAILESRGMGWGDVLRSVAYLKDAAYEPAFAEIRRARGLEKLPCVWIQADVCRGDLLFEIELDAAAAR